MVHFAKTRDHQLLAVTQKVFLDKFSTTGTIPKMSEDLGNVKYRDDETLLEYLKRFKKIHDEIGGITQDTAITCFKGGFRSKMLYTKLQLRKLKTICEMFSMAIKVALA